MVADRTCDAAHGANCRRCARNASLFVLHCEYCGIFDPLGWLRSVERFTWLAWMLFIPAVWWLVGLLLRG